MPIKQIITYEGGTTMYCSKCGNKLLSGAGFCSVCGTSVSSQGYSSAGVYDGQYNRLVEYFKILVDMETHVYMQQTVINMLEDKISSLGVKKQIKEPVLQKLDKSEYMPIVLSVIPCGVVGGLIIYLITGILADLLGLGYLPINFPTIRNFMVGTGVACLAIFLLGYLRDKSRKQGKYDWEYNNYVKQCRDEEERLKKEAWLKNMLNSEKRKMNRRLEDSIQNLQMIYSKNICYEKYRNIIAVCSIYEYLASKRCYQLVGADGCYNLFEQEIRADLIILKLDEIINKLDQIQKNQNKLYWAINDSNRNSRNMIEATNKMLDTLYTTNSKLDGMSKEISELNRQTAIEAYNTERIAQELAYLNRMELKTDKYKDIIYYQK